MWIRLFRTVRAIAEPWDEGDGLEWSKMAVDRVTWQWLCGMPTPALCRGRFPSHWRPPLPGGGSRTATYPVVDSHQARINEGRTEERGPVIQRINRDLRSRGSVPYIGPQTLSRTFLIIPEISGTLYRRPFLDRSRQHENSREAARHFRNVPNCAVYRNYESTE